MLRPFGKITIGSLEFDFFTEFEVVSSWDVFTDKAKLKLPSRFKKGGETIVAGTNNLFKRGEPVTIEVGYYPTLTRVFKGFVSGVKPDSPLLLEFEDSSYLFKQKNITTSFESVSLKSLLTSLCPIPFKTVDAELGTLRLTRVNFTQVLDELRETYGIVSFVRDGTLYCGLAYWPELRNDHEIIVDGPNGVVIENSLEYMREDDVAVKVKAISILPDNKKIEIEVGDPDGAQKTLNFYSLNAKELKEAAERELPRMKYEGYRGSFKTFGFPSVFHGDAVTLRSLKFPERDGTYLVDEVTTSSGLNGFRQDIKLGPKI